MKFSHFILAALAGAAAMVFPGPPSAPAQPPPIQLPAAATVTDIRSPAFVQTEKDALALWKQGDRGQAKAMMYGQSTDAAPPDAAAAKLRLGYMNLADRNADEARRLFEAVADGPAGVNDAAKTEAAMRLGYMAVHDGQYDLARARFQRLLSGEYSVTHSDAVEACHRLGALEHRRHNLQDALPYFQAIAEQTSDPAASSNAQTELAGLWIELGKGEGRSPIPPEERAAAFDKSRMYCQSVIDEAASPGGAGVPLDRAMIAELMRFESYYFQKDYDKAFELGADFLEHWGTDTASYDDINMKIYVNTAKTFHTLNAYLTGHYGESLVIAEDLTTNKPPTEERFKDFDAYMYGCTCGFLSSQALGRTADAQRYEDLARNYNARHFEGLYPYLIKRTDDSVAAKEAKEEEAATAVAQTNP